MAPVNVCPCHQTLSMALDQRCTNSYQRNINPCFFTWFLFSNLLCLTHIHAHFIFYLKIYLPELYLIFWIVSKIIHIVFIYENCEYFFFNKLFYYYYNFISYNFIWNYFISIYYNLRSKSIIDWKENKVQVKLRFPLCNNSLSIIRSTLSNISRKNVWIIPLITILIVIKNTRYCFFDRVTKFSIVNSL